MSNTLVTAQNAENWLAGNGFDDASVHEAHANRFFNTPHSSSHAFIAMVCIANCAETPQDYESVYFAVREWADVLDPNSPEGGVPQNKTGIIREATVARGEMTREEYDEKITFKLVELGITLDY